MKNKLLTLARQTLQAYFENKKPLIPDEIKQKYSKKQACFVTLTKQDELRGCIGSLQPRQELYKDVIENTISAAFHDPRFFPLSKEELKQIKIEISILTIPKKLIYSNAQDLLKKINNKQGIIIRQGFNQATYLPQVWEQLPNKEQFLCSLCVKAGLMPDCWKSQKSEISDDYQKSSRFLKKANLEVQVYEVEKLQE